MVIVVSVVTAVVVAAVVVAAAVVVVVVAVVVVAAVVVAAAVAAVVAAVVVAAVVVAAVVVATVAVHVARENPPEHYLDFQSFRFRWHLDAAGLDELFWRWVREIGRQKYFVPVRSLQSSKF